MRKIIRVYADTSVFGGVFDEEFEQASKVFFKEVENGKFILVTSQLVREEISAAPDKVRKHFEKMLHFAQIVEISGEVLELQSEYVKEGIVGREYQTDALHVALATVSKIDVIVSWNFKHIVNFQKIPLYNAVNKLNGYEEIGIYSPLEVIDYED